MDYVFNLTPNFTVQSNTVDVTEVVKQQVSFIPERLFWIFLVSFVLLLIYIKADEYINKEIAWQFFAMRFIGLFALAMQSIVLLFTWLILFKPSHDTLEWLSNIGGFLFFAFLVWFVYRVYKMRKDVN